MWPSVDRAATGGRRLARANYRGPVHLDPTDANIHALLARNIQGPVTMLNLLRFVEVADYSASPELAPPDPISGRAAYERYMAHTTPFLEATGGTVSLVADGGAWFIGPDDEQWDLALLVNQSSIESFFSFASDEAYLTGIGHRTAALADSRLLPLVVQG